jgi:O-acetyl-ADP-ribose deacetylase (regulator of RNase III)
MSELVRTSGNETRNRCYLFSNQPYQKTERNGLHSEFKKLAARYCNSSVLAAENGCKSFAFRCNSTGVYGYPKEAVAQIAVREVGVFLAAKNVKDAEVMEVVFCCFSERDKSVYEQQGVL